MEARADYDPNEKFTTVIPPEQVITLEPEHWFKGKAMIISGFGPRPRGLHQWSRCLWNADIFYGPIPFLKSVALVSWLLAVLA